MQILRPQAPQRCKAPTGASTCRVVGTSTVQQGPSVGLLTPGGATQCDVRGSPDGSARHRPTRVNPPAARSRDAVDTAGSAPIGTGSGHGSLQCQPPQCLWMVPAQKSRQPRRAYVLFWSRGRERRHRDSKAARSTRSQYFSVDVDDFSTGRFAK